MGLPPTNLATVIQLIWAEGEISRAEIARRTGLSRSTVSALVQVLLDQGSVVEARVGRSGGGRPPVMLRFARDRYQLLGVDLGATHISVVATTVHGDVLARRAERFAVESDPTGAIALLERLVEGTLDDASRPGTRILGMGVAVPCPVHTERPGELSPSILPAWTGIDLAARLSARFGVPAYLENDANLGALGELAWGRGRGTGDFVYVKLATGVGAGLIVSGDIYRGAEGIAGEIGHTAIDAHGPPCRCGLSGCLESMISSEAIERRYRSKPGADPSADLSTIARLAADGDPVAVDVVSTAARFLGIGLANLLNLVNPARIVLGGRLTLAGDALLVPLQGAIRARAMWTNVAAADVVISELGDASVPLGAATLVLRTALAEPRTFELGLPPKVPRPDSLVGNGLHPSC